MSKQGQLMSYKCSVNGIDWWTTNATSKGQAKMEFYRYLDDCYVDCYLQILCRNNGNVYTSEEFIKNAIYRGIEFAYCGMVVETTDGFGVIVGHNSSANLDVLFTSGKLKGQTCNCHPNWKIKYYDKNGVCIKSFQD